MIDFPIVDAHFHVWDLNRFDYPWLADLPELNKTMLLDEYRRATDGTQVEKTVFVQCQVDPSQYKREEEWFTELAKTQDERIRGIVPWCPLEKADAARRELEALAANPLVKGVRRVTQWDPDLEFCLRPYFIRGTNLLAQYDVTFDICIDYWHTKVATQFVDRCPNVRMTLDHIGKPDIGGGRLDPWRSEIAELAKRENVWCKTSSLATEANHDRWTFDEIRPYVGAIFESFGVDRCFFGGDWPVSSQAASSRFSRPSSFMRCRSSLVTPARRPLVDLGLPNPPTKRFGRAANLTSDRTDRRPLR